MKITSDDIKWFKEAHDIVKKGHYPDSQMAIDSYKRIFADEIAAGKKKGNLSPKCGSCIREAVNQVYNAIKEMEDKYGDFTD